MLRKFKIKLNRENLEKIYFTYIRPLLEYACELWDGCTILDLNKIEQIQHEAARIVTGLPKFASIESLYFACLNLFRVGAFLNCGLNLFHVLIVEGKKEFANNGNLVSGFLSSVWLRIFNLFSPRIKGSKQSYKYNGLSLLRIL
jgi:hypothetical protein